MKLQTELSALALPTTAEVMVGIDIGSTTVKILVVRGGEVVYSCYERHFSRVREKTLELMEEIAPLLRDAPFTLAITGSAGYGMARTASLPFVQEVFATGETVRRLQPDTNVVVELGGEDAKVIFFDGGTDERMNGSCAGGTGALSTRWPPCWTFR